MIPCVCWLQDGLVINHHADHTLNSFCQWQSGLGGRGGRRHDHAILLTGLDICSWKNEPCDTLGEQTQITLTLAVSLTLTVTLTLTLTVTLTFTITLTLNLTLTLTLNLPLPLTLPLT